MSSQKVALVTGSSRGIGRGIALGLAEHGWDIVVNYHSNISAAEEVLKAVQALGSDAL
jgi:NAD(P)-dependent dehydrogenase (short-subunit alcohol dehydrogenase family)